MNMEKLFDLLCHMNDEDTRGTEYKMGKGIILQPNHQEKLVKDAIQAFMHQPAHIIDADRKKAIQAFSGSSDLAQLTTDVFNVTQATPEYDLYWQQAFRTINLMQGQLSWEIGNVTSGLAMEKIPEGGKVKIGSIAGTKQSVSVEKYGLGLGITWEIIHGRKLYKFIDIMEFARSELYNTWADVHYALLATAGATNTVAYDDTGANALEKDIITINTALHDIAEDNKDSGYGNPNAARYAFYLDPSLEARIERAFRVTSAELAGSTLGGLEVLRRNVSRYYSYNGEIPANKGLLVLTGNRIQNAIYLRELGLSKQDIESLNEIRTYWTAFGAAVGDNDQVYEVSFS